MSDPGFDPAWPWPRFPNRPTGLPGFHAIPPDEIAGDEPGLFHWKPPQMSLDPMVSAVAGGKGNGETFRWPELPGQTTALDATELPSLRYSVADGPPGFHLGESWLPQPARNAAPADFAASFSDSPSVLPSSAPLASVMAAPASAGAFDISTIGSRLGSMVGQLASRAAPEIAKLAGRAAPAAAELAAGAVPALAGAASAAAGVLPMLVTPTNSQSDMTDLGDGLRARSAPGQRTMEIQRRVDDGLFGTGIGAKWTTLPVDAERVIGRDGRESTVINRHQLNQALGLTTPSEDALVSAMARPPKDEPPGQLPPIAPQPVASPAPPGAAVRPAPQSILRTKIDARTLEEAKRSDPDEERVLACRAVRTLPGKPAQSGQYDGRDGIDTAVGVRVAPGFPAPKAGYEYAPDYARHSIGHRGELELGNRIRTAVPYEIFVHYGNPAGDTGPDALTVGPDRRFMEWDSRWRSAKRRLGPSLATSRTLSPEKVNKYVSAAVAAGTLSPAVAAEAVAELRKGNYNLCTVGTGNASDGYVELVRNHLSEGPRR
ncbi:hypothetical protein [Reyranella sp.]|uniref:hypothetical protein n=1 Tax=Reyranella sp. TaxID=1929291 RepID=UPI003BAC21D1